MMTLKRYCWPHTVCRVGGRAGVSVPPGSGTAPPHVAHLVMVQGVQGQGVALWRVDAQGGQQLKHLLLDHHVGRVQSCRGKGPLRGAWGPLLPVLPSPCLHPLPGPGSHPTAANLLGWQRPGPTAHIRHWSLDMLAAPRTPGRGVEAGAAPVTGVLIPMALRSKLGALGPRPTPVPLPALSPCFLQT